MNFAGQNKTRKRALRRPNKKKANNRIPFAKRPDGRKLTPFPFFSTNHIFFFFQVSLSEVNGIFVTFHKSALLQQQPARTASRNSQHPAINQLQWTAISQNS
jgi:hypothetical protein